MIITRILLDTGKRNTIRALVNPNRFHGALENARPGERTRLLWRIDSLNGKTYLIILSQKPIQTDGIISQFGYEDQPAEEKNYDSLLERITEGSRWRFRLTANPTNSSSTVSDHGKRGKVMAHTSPKFQMIWLEKKGTQNGFSVDPALSRVVYSKWLNFRKREDDMNSVQSAKAEVTVKEAVFEGVLTVTDPEKFRQALISGIGRSKAYGMGLMTIVPYYE